MPKISQQNRFFIRLSLVTTSTIAAVIGAQSLAAFDLQQQNNTPANTEPVLPIAEPVSALPTQDTVQQVAPSLNIRQSEPNIIILRRTGTSSNNTVNSNPAPVITNNSSVNIAPPSPVALEAPAPVVVQQSAAAPRPVSRRS